MDPIPPGASPRPPCMQRLGLLPPYSIEDVKKAYRQRAKAAHPDGGGNSADFAALHADYQRALSLAAFHESRRRWLGDRVERYVERTQLIAQLEELGGRADFQRPDNYLQDYGPDYAEILCELVAIHLNGSSATDAALQTLCNSAVFPEVQLLDLSESAVTDVGLQAMAGSGLAGLNLRGTKISVQSLDVMKRLQKLEWLHLGQTKIGLWSRWRLRKNCPQLEVVTNPAAEPPEFDSLEYRQLKLMQRLSDDPDG